MKVTKQLDLGKLEHINKIVEKCLVLTGNQVISNLKESQTMPFDTGHMQNQQTSLDDSEASKGRVIITVDTPYARRLYFHPEYNFQKTKNPNAGGMWFHPYLDGVKKDYAQKVFTRLLRNRI